MLTGVPADWWVLDGDSSRVVRKRREFGLACPEPGHLPSLSLFGVENGQICIQNPQCSYHAVEEKQSNRNPDIDMHLDRRMDVHKPDENGKRNEMLQDE